MKTILRSLLLLGLLLFSLQSCEDQDDIAAPANLQINDFIWKGLNQYYLWQADVPNLSDERFGNKQSALNSFLSGYAEPENLFQDLLNKPASKFPKGEAIDRFSWIVKDYSVLEQELQGTSKSTGIDFKLSYKGESNSDLVGFVRYVVPGSDASGKSIKRGDLFTAVNGTPLTASNYRQLLLDSESYTLNLAQYNGNVIESNGKSVTLVKTTLNENPILINKVITSGSHKIGYLMYNGFYSTYDSQLNDAFEELATQGVTDLVLDLRYNGGGSVQTATRLASMITGQFKDQIFAKEKWNAKLTAYLETEDSESLNNRFVDNINGRAINSLRLSKVYVLTSNGTASASELIINGLVPYITVVQIGDYTVGKNVGSVTLYDSETFTKNKVNTSHKYAMQPLVLKIVNATGFGEYTDGLKPAYEQLEYLSNLGVLGDPSEPLLNTAIAKITGASAKKVQQDRGKALRSFIDSKAMNGIGNQMYVEKAPEGLLRTLN
ncbi:S41 family peptidase [Flavobacterium sp. FlaQc-52]|uniref:S41 family peptidase n=1 Tax=Flavobacterium sp. FlaQc-52 TaxID=3374185 RepID=UPI003756EA2A